MDKIFVVCLILLIVLILALIALVVISDEDEHDDRDICIFTFVRCDKPSCENCEIYEHYKDEYNKE